MRKEAPSMLFVIPALAAGFVSVAAAAPVRVAVNAAAVQGGWYQRRGDGDNDLDDRGDNDGRFAQGRLQGCIVRFERDRELTLSSRRGLTTVRLTGEAARRFRD